MNKSVKLNFKSNLVFSNFVKASVELNI